MRMTHGRMVEMHRKNAPLMLNAFTATITLCAERERERAASVSGHVVQGKRESRDMEEARTRERKRATKASAKWTTDRTKATTMEMIVKASAAA
jgi:hypothetical protein